jgi:hypothetical protein
MASLSLPPLSVYYCYSPVDVVFRNALDVHLDPIKRHGWIQTWDDQQIPAGTEWEREREAHLHTAHLLVLLVSADFLASESGAHMIQVALQRHQTGEAIAIPILIRSANWEETDLRILQVLPREQKAITTWPDQDDIWREVTREIQHVVEAMRQWVFVVSSPEDQVFVEQLRQDMAPSSVLLWSLEKGQDETQRDAMRAASTVILVASPDAPSSRLVKAQLALAADYQRPILVVWARGEDWRTSNPGNWRVQEVIDIRGKSYETARKTLLIRLRQEVAILPSLVYLDPHTEPRNPYKGLHAFIHDDAGDFFGRESLIGELAIAVETMLTLEKQGSRQVRLLPVIGPSGSGKSSVVMAGLIPRLQSGGIFDSQEWVYLDPMFPGVHPLEALAVSFAPQFPARSVLSLHEDFTSDSMRALHLLACQLVNVSQKKVVLVVDQFEELFTLTISEEERQHFLDLLVTAVTEPYGPTLVILTLRADFYDRPMQYPEFYRLLDKYHISVLLMEIDDLRKVIEQPAQLPDVQLTFDGDLVGNLLFEMRGQAGALPLLQFTLDQLFQQRDGHLLSLQAYLKMGGVKGALSQYAEETYKALPSDAHRRLARDVSLRLIDPGITEQDTTRRRAALSEFDLAEASEKQQMQETLDAFIKARLLTTSQNRGTITVEVSHEAVIREWKRLAEWLREAREDIHFQQSLSEDVAEWEQRKQPKDRLYRGAQLKEAQAWAKHNRPSQHEGAFLRACAAQRTLSLVRLSVIVLLLVSSMGIAGWYFLTLPPSSTLVTTLQDNVAGSLRYCITSAPSGSTIRFAQDMRGTIVLGGDLTFMSNKRLTIVGPGANQLTISNGNSNAVIRVPDGATLNISGLSLKNSVTHVYAFLSNQGSLKMTGSIVSNNKNVVNGVAYGGGIYNYDTGNLTLIDSTVSNNTAQSTSNTSGSQGGGIENSGTLAVSNSTISGNTAASDSGSFGGGIYINKAGTVTVSNSTISGNTASGSSGNGVGGGISNSGKLTVTTSILRDNKANSSSASSFGGGIYNYGTLTMSSSTISGNASSSTNTDNNTYGQGGGIDNEGTISVSSSIIRGNKAVTNGGYALGGGIANYSTGIITVTSSTISGNTASNSSNAAEGGGISNSGKLTVSNNTLRDNQAISNKGSSYGGGIENTDSSMLLLISSMLISNSASGQQGSYGGGVNNGGMLTMINCTLLNNSANNVGRGGGISYIGAKDTSAVIRFCTIYNNISRGEGGGIWTDPTENNHLTISDGMVVGNNAQQGSDMSGPVISDGYNLLSNVAGVTGLNATTDRRVTLSDLKLDPTLRSNGGPTQTLVLLPGSPAIDAVPGNACSITITDISGHPMAITTDQRGNPRPDGSENACDVGAYESAY